MEITERRLFELLGRLYAEAVVLREAVAMQAAQLEPARNGVTDELVREAEPVEERRTGVQHR